MGKLKKQRGSGNMLEALQQSIVAFKLKNDATFTPHALPAGAESISADELVRVIRSERAAECGNANGSASALSVELFDARDPTVQYSGAMPIRTGSSIIAKRVPASRTK